MSDDASPAFGDLLRGARRRSGLTQEALAEKAGLSVRGISDLERGILRAPRRDTLGLLADALDLTAAERNQWEQERRRLAVRSSHRPGVRGTPKTETNLPAPLTTFIAREREVAEVSALLQRADTRLVTITGTGGVGKTRLAIAVGHNGLGTYRDGVWFVSLASLDDPRLVLPAVAATLHISDGGNRTLLETMANALSDTRRLLVLDNMEQVVAAAPSIAGLLEACPHLRVLATSRVPLQVAGEQEYPLEPLALPGVDDATDVEQLLESAAVNLFMARAQSVNPTFALTSANALAIAGICRHLDGLPLALELAAARVRLLSPQTMLQRLQGSLTLLRSNEQGIPARHRTLRDTIAWSYDLLAPREQHVFRTLSVFRAGCLLDAAESVAASAFDGEPAGDVLDSLERLIEHNLVRVRHQEDGAARFTMLEMLREFGLEQLEESGEADSARQRLATFLFDYFAPAHVEVHDPQGLLWLARCDAELDNVRAALEWAVDHDAEIALRLCRSFDAYWWRRGQYSEARRWHERAFASGQPISHSTRAYALREVVMHATTQGDYVIARRLIEEALTLFRELDNRSGVAECFFCLGRIAMHTGDHLEARRHYEESLALCRDDEPFWMVGLFINLATVAIASGDYARAPDYLKQGLEFARRRADLAAMVALLADSGFLALKVDDLPRARRLLDECLTLLRRHAPERRYAVQALEICAWLAAVERQPERVALLLGAASRERDSMGVPAPVYVQAEYDQHVPDAQSLIDTVAWDQAWSEGEAMSMAAAIAYAQSGAPEPS